jgi:hypothetical protein
VPVLISNYRNEDEQFPNVGSSPRNSWQLVRRFFIYETLSGVQSASAYEEGLRPYIIRFATKIELKITLDKKENEEIYLPLLKITYKEKVVKEIKDSTSVKVQFNVDYNKSWSNFWRDYTITFWVLQILAVGIFAARAYSWSEKNPSQFYSDPSKYTKMLALKMAFYFFDSFSQFNFWMVYFTAMWAYVTYKMQENAYMVLPSADDMDGIYGAFNAVFFMIAIF